MRGFGGGQSNVMMMRNESISDSLVAMLGSCASPHVGLQGVHWTYLPRRMVCFLL